jgi:hypothetical protein
MHGWLEEEARVDEAMCFGAGDEAAQWFLGRQKSERERERGHKIATCGVRERRA